MAERRHDDLDWQYEETLQSKLVDAADGSSSQKYQWSIMLNRIIDRSENTIYEVTNRGWRMVGPMFDTQDQGSRWLGFRGKGDAAFEHMNQLIKEYEGLYSDPVETRKQFEATKKSFGRPSQGRSIRLQTSVTPEVNAWIEKQQRTDESLSETIYRLLEQMREGK